MSPAVFTPSTRIGSPKPSTAMPVYPYRARGAPSSARRPGEQGVPLGTARTRLARRSPNWS